MSAGRISRLKSSKISLLKTREPSSLKSRSLASRWMSVPSRALRGSEIGEQEEDVVQSGSMKKRNRRTLAEALEEDRDLVEKLVLSRGVLSRAKRSVS